VEPILAYTDLNIPWNDLESPFFPAKLKFNVASSAGVASTSTTSASFPSTFTIPTAFPDE